VSSEGAEWQEALELLAAAEPDARVSLAALLQSGDGPATRSLELVVVTSRVDRPLVERLLERALTRRPVAVVHVEPESYAGRPRRPEPNLLRLQAAGVPIAAVRCGEDLAAALEGERAGEVAHA
jgi:riboflavin biosynthesis pyrimidine reductase